MSTAWSDRGQDAYPCPRCTELEAYVTPGAEIPQKGDATLSSFTDSLTESKQMLDKDQDSCQNGVDGGDGFAPNDLEGLEDEHALLYGSWLQAGGEAHVDDPATQAGHVGSLGTDDGHVRMRPPRRRGLRARHRMAAEAHRQGGYAHPVGVQGSAGDAE